MKFKLRLAALLALALSLALPGAAFAGGSSPPGIAQSGTITPGHCAQFSASGVAIDAGATCGTGTSGVSQSTGTANGVLVNGDSAAHTGATTYSLSPTLNLGVNATTQGSVKMFGGTSGDSTVQAAPAGSSSVLFQLPPNNGTNGYGLQGDGAGHLSYAQFLAATNNLSDLTNAATARTNLGLGTAATQNTGTSGANIPLLNAANTWSLAQTFTLAPVWSALAGGGTQCVHVNNSGVPSGTGSDCGTGGGGTSPGGTSGQIQYNNAGVFGGFTVSGDGTLNTATGALAVTKINGDANVALLDVNQSYTKGQAVTPLTTSPCGTQSAAGTLTMDLSLSNSCVATFGAGNLTIANPTSAKAGQPFTLKLVQDSVGSRTASWGANFKWTGGTAPTLTTTANGYDIISCIAITTTELDCNNNSASGGSGITALTGDVTASGSGSVSATLAASGVAAGTYGDGTHVAQVTLDAKGRATAASSVAITASASNIAPGTTTVVGGTCPSGQNLYNNAGVVGCQANGGGSGSLVKIGTATASNSTCLSWGVAVTGCVNGSTTDLSTLGYNTFTLKCDSIAPGTSSGFFYLHVWEGATPTEKTTNYGWARNYMNMVGAAAGTVANSGDTTAANNVGISLANGTVTGATFTTTAFINLGTTSIPRDVTFTSTANLSPTAISSIYYENGMGVYVGDQSAITAISFDLYSTGNGTQETGAAGLISGTCTLYGLVN